MPTSDHRQISVVLDIIQRLPKQSEPYTILDIGIGYGKYGTLLREYQPGCYLVGIDTFDAYGDHEEEGDGQKWWAYDAIGYQNVWPAQRVLGGLKGILQSRTDNPRYDLGLMIDVIEHFPPERVSADGTTHEHTQRDALEAAMRICDNLVIATPHDAMQWPQTDLPNPAEAHWPAPSIGWLSFVAVGQGMELAECHHLPDSYVASFRQHSA